MRLTCRRSTAAVAMPDFTANGLYDARVFAPATSTFDAQGLLAVKDGDTLVLTFRGTDGEDPAVVSGQAFTGAGMAAHYKAFKPLINAAYAYLQSHPEITDVVISGHSLGAAMVDVFTLVDAARFRALRPDGLTIVSVASSGVPKDLADFLGGIDTTAATIVDKVITDVFGVEFVHHVIKALHLPDDYISITNAGDRAHFPNNYPDIPEDIGLIPIVTLKHNLQFGGDTLFHLPNIGNTDVQYDSIFTHPFDFRGMGAEHNSALLWANLQGLVSDALFQFYSGQNLIAGVTDYNHVPDLNGKPVALFAGFLELNNPSYMNDHGGRTLHGKATADFILGMAGDDREEGNGGSDLLSGGLGDDRLLGGRGKDHVSGGLGTDVMNGGTGRDTFHYGDVRESRPDNRADIINGFEADFDRIDVSPIDAAAGKTGQQDFDFIGRSAFTGEGQVRAIQVGGNTLLLFNTHGTRGADMEILLTNVNASTLTGDSFIL